MIKQPNSRSCFLCGIENPIGLKLSFYTDEENRCIVRYTPHEHLQGYPGVLHGGIICALLDETIGRTLVPDDLWAMTVQLNVRFHKPVPLDQELTVIGELVAIKSRLVQGRGEVRLADGSVAASAEAKFLLLSDDKMAEFRSELGYWEVVPDTPSADGTNPTTRA
jgi:uncharacterized protein (TIGR00369 family)